MEWKWQAVPLPVLRSGYVLPDQMADMVGKEIVDVAGEGLLPKQPVQQVAEFGSERMDVVGEGLPPKPPVRQVAVVGEGLVPEPPVLWSPTPRRSALKDARRPGSSLGS